MITECGKSDDFDEARVEAIRDRIDDDNYNVDPDAVASKFIDLEMALRGERC